jgi:hypothetical protein
MAPVPAEVQIVEACITNTAGTSCVTLTITQDVATALVPAPVGISQIDAFAYGTPDLLYQGSASLDVPAGSQTPAVIHMACVSELCDPSSGEIIIVATFPEREVEPNNDLSAAQALEPTFLPWSIVHSVNGLVPVPDDWDYSGFLALQGSDVVVGLAGATFAACVYLLDASGSLLNGTCDDTPAQVTATYVGTYYLVVTSLDGTVGRYTAWVEEHPPGGAASAQ